MSTYEVPGDFWGYIKLIDFLAKKMKDFDECPRTHEQFNDLMNLFDILQKQAPESPALQEGRCRLLETALKNFETCYVVHVEKDTPG